jgi:pimeloyl-ACP methyl ester carboxylesterase
MRILTSFLTLCLSLTLFSQSGFHQKADHLLQYMDLSGMETGILYDRSYPVADLRSDAYADKEMTATYFLQAYAELSESDYLNRFQPISELKAIRAAKDGTVGVGLLNVELEYVSKQAMLDGLLYMDVDGFIRRNNLEVSPFVKHDVQIIAPLMKRIQGLEVEFALDASYIVQTREISVEQVQLDLGNGFVDLPMNGSAIKHRFAEGGAHDLVFKLFMSNGDVLERQSSIRVDKPAPTEEMKGPGMVTGTKLVNAQIAYQGYDESIGIKGQGQGKVYLDNINGVFDKPIIVVDGFDPGDTRSIEDIYALLDFGDTGENLADMVRDQGYDVVLLNFPNYEKNGVAIDGGADYIQRNAMVLVEALRRVNNRKVGNAENIVIGPSMGGLISRYALRYMEMNDLDHETGLYVSFDSPHLGANLPIGAQYLINYYGYEYGDQAIQDLVNQALRSAAAKQMLLDHVDGHLASGSLVEQNPSLRLPAGAPDFRETFQAELDAMGFPQNCRNISLVNGSGIGTTVESPNALALNTTFDIAFSTSADATLRYTPYAGNTNTVCSLTGYILWFIPIFSFDATSQAYTWTDGYDSAPGGTTDILATLSAFGDGAASLFDPNDIFVEAFSFIPVFSSLALDGEIDQHAAINPANVTAFDSYYAPEANEEHVTLTQANVDYVLNEIYGLLAGGIQPGDEDLFSLKSSLVQQELWFEILRPELGLKQVQMRILNVTGQVLSQDVVNVSGSQVNLAVSLTPGVYLAELSTGDYRQVERFVVQ